MLFHPGCPQCLLEAWRWLGKGQVKDRDKFLPRSPLLSRALGGERNAGCTWVWRMAPVCPDSFSVFAGTPPKVKWAGSKPDWKEDDFMFSLYHPPTLSFKAHL